MVYTDAVIGKLLDRVIALEIAVAWLIAKDERESFTMDCIDLMQWTAVRDGSVDKYDLEEMNDQFNEIMMWAHHLVQAKARHGGAASPS